MNLHHKISPILLEFYIVDDAVICVGSGYKQLEKGIEPNIDRIFSNVIFQYKIFENFRFLKNSIDKKFRKIQ